MVHPSSLPLQAPPPSTPVGFVFFMFRCFYFLWFTRSFVLSFPCSPTQFWNTGDGRGTVPWNQFVRWCVCVCVCLVHWNTVGFPFLIFFLPESNETRTNTHTHSLTHLHSQFIRISRSRNTTCCENSNTSAHFTKPTESLFWKGKFPILIQFHWPNKVHKSKIVQLVGWCKMNGCLKLVNRFYFKRAMALTFTFSYKFTITSVHSLSFCSTSVGLLPLVPHAIKFAKTLIVAPISFISSTRLLITIVSLSSSKMEGLCRFLFPLSLKLLLLGGWAGCNVGGAVPLPVRTQNLDSELVNHVFATVITNLLVRLGLGSSGGTAVSGSKSSGSPESSPPTWFSECVLVDWCSRSGSLSSSKYLNDSSSLSSWDSGSSLNISMINGHSSNPSWNKIHI